MHNNTAVKRSPCCTGGQKVLTYYPDTQMYKQTQVYKCYYLLPEQKVSLIYIYAMLTCPTQNLTEQSRFEFKRNSGSMFPSI